MHEVAIKMTGGQLETSGDNRSPESLALIAANGTLEAPGIRHAGDKGDLARLQI